MMDEWMADLLLWLDEEMSEQAKRPVPQGDPGNLRMARIEVAQHIRDEVEKMVALATDGRVSGRWPK